MNLKINQIQEQRKHSIKEFKRKYDTKNQLKENADTQQKRTLIQVLHFRFL